MLWYVPARVSVGISYIGCRDLPPQFMSCSGHRTGIACWMVVAFPIGVVKFCGGRMALADTAMALLRADRKRGVWRCMLKANCGEGVNGRRSLLVLERLNHMAALTATKYLPYSGRIL